MLACFQNELLKGNSLYPSALVHTQTWRQAKIWEPVEKREAWFEIGEAKFSRYVISNCECLVKNIVIFHENNVMCLCNGLIIIITLKWINKYFISISFLY